MEKSFAHLEELAGSVKEYIHTRIELVKLQAAEKTSSVIANMVAGLVAAMIFLLVALLLSVALSLLIGAAIGKMWAGFAIVAGFYLLIGIIVWMARGKLIRIPVMNALIRQLFSTDEED